MSTKTSNYGGLHEFYVTPPDSATIANTPARLDRLSRMSRLDSTSSPKDSGRGDGDAQESILHAQDGEGTIQGLTNLYKQDSGRIKRTGRYSKVLTPQFSSVLGRGSFSDPNFKYASIVNKAIKGGIIGGSLGLSAVLGPAVINRLRKKRDSDSLYDQPQTRLDYESFMTPAGFMELQSDPRLLAQVAHDLRTKGGPFDDAEDPRTDLLFKALVAGTGGAVVGGAKGVAKGLAEQGE